MFICESPLHKAFEFVRSIFILGFLNLNARFLLFLILIACQNALENYAGLAKNETVKTGSRNDEEKGDPIDSIFVVSIL